MKCTCGAELKALRSAAGWYMGTTTEYGSPNCRITGYYDSKEAAEKALASGEVRYAEENNFCNKGCGCIPVNNARKYMLIKQMWTICEPCLAPTSNGGYEACLISVKHVTKVNAKNNLTYKPVYKWYGYRWQVMYNDCIFDEFMLKKAAQAKRRCLHELYPMDDVRIRPVNVSPLTDLASF